MTKPKLTIGMATFDDFQGIWATVQALRLYHEVVHQCEIVVVDNNPRSKHGEYAKNLLLGKVRSAHPAVQYAPLESPVGTAAPRNKVFEVATADYVLCLDPHVLLVPRAIDALLDYYAANPDTQDLLSGPLVYDDLVKCDSQFNGNWDAEMWGQWDGDQAALDKGEPFEIPAMGLGLFSCRKNAWLGFNENFRGFGGEEWYIHEKFRQAGRRCLCIPQLGWVHRFGHPNGVRYPSSSYSKCRNYVIGLTELGLSLDPVYAEFVDKKRVTPQQWEYLLKDPVTRVLPEGQRAAVELSPQDEPTLDELFMALRATPRDLDQHADDLRELASQARRIIAFVKRKEWNVFLAAGRPKELIVYQQEDHPILPVLFRAVNRDESKEPRHYTQHLQRPVVNPATAVPMECDLLVYDLVMQADELWAFLERHAPLAKRVLIRGTADFGHNGEHGGPGLLPPIRKWLTERPEWTVVKRSNKQYGWHLLSRDPADKKPLPSVVRQGINAMMASWRNKTNVLKGYGTLKDTDVHIQRLAVCLECSSRNEMNCGECGCPIDRKTSHANEECPIGLWTRVKEVTQ